MEQERIVILTRFNLNHDAESCTRHLDHDWLVQRVEIFEQYCLPSIASQSDADFDWVVMFDLQTPIDILSRIEEDSRHCQQLKIKLLPFYANYNDAYAAIGREYIGKVLRLITIRLDNDDALNRRFIELVRQKLPVESNGKIILSFPQGLQLFVKPQTLMRVKCKDNHFLVLAENADANVKTSLGFEHTTATRNLHTTIFSTSEPMWLEVVHNLNIIINDFSLFLLPRPTTSAKRLESFAIDAHVEIIFWRNTAFLILQSIAFGFNIMLRIIRKIFGAKILL